MQHLHSSCTSKNCSVNYKMVALIFFLFATTMPIIISSDLVAADGQWLPAHATFYGADQDPASLGGACGYDNTFHAGFGIHTVALSATLFQDGQACGACFEVVCDAAADPQWCLRRATVTVIATNFCPPNNNGPRWCDPPRRHLDMSIPAFSSIARVGPEGIVPILYRRVGCKRSGGVRFTLKGQANFNLVMFSNVGGSGDVRAAWIKGSRAASPPRSSTSYAWSPMQRNWGANWQTNGDYRRQSLSFRLVLGDGSTLEFSGVVPASWSPGETYVARAQFA